LLGLYMVENWVDLLETNAEINRDIQAMNNVEAEIWGVRVVDEAAGFDSDPQPYKLATCKIRLDLWHGDTKDETDLVGKLTSDVDIRQGDHLKFQTSGEETGSRGIDDSPVGKDWDLVVQRVRAFGDTKEVELKWS